MEALRKKMGGGRKRSEGGKKRCGDINQKSPMRTDNQLTGQQKMLLMHPVFSRNTILRQPRLRKSPRAMLISALVDLMIMMQMRSIHILWTTTTILSFQERLLKLGHLGEISHVRTRYAHVDESQEG
jgi:hypothetical protein